ncbi:Alpha-agarase precursor [Phycisphaerae bacterium RAS2]|nr:Alpha-agarase precursor [Phycisphaerae bacterium RAS2]
MRKALTWVIAGLLGVAVSASQAQTLYTTGFDGSPFVNGNLSGQDGWVTTDSPETPFLGTVQGSFSFSPSRSVRINASQTIDSNWWWTPLNHSIHGSATVIQIECMIYVDRASGSASTLWGVDIYDGSLPLTRRVATIAIDTSNHLLVWDSVAFVDTGVIVPPNTWGLFRMNLNYAAGERNTSVYFNGARVAYRRAFGLGANDILADVDFYHVDAGGNDSAYFDNFVVRAMADGDGDGVPDSQDSCLNTAAGDPINATGCSTLDNDGDGVLNDADNCPDTPTCAIVNGAGCPFDSDGDSVMNGCDNCDNVPNGPGEDNQADADSDGRGDACDVCPFRRPGDTTGDGIVDGRDAQLFVRILTGGSGTPDETCACDVNEDTFVNEADIPALVTLLLNQ